MVCLSRTYHFTFFKGCLPQILLGPLLSTLSQIWEDRFSVLTFFSNELRNTLVPNSLDKLMQQFQWNHIYIYPEKSAQRSTKLMQLNDSHLKIFKLKIYSSSLFLVTLFCPCYLMKWFCYLKHLCVFSPFLSRSKLHNFCH